jgi:hypothetical protein
VAGQSKGGDVSWAQAFRDIVIASMNKGQLPLLAIAGVAALIIWRMPPADVSLLANEILSRLDRGDLTGWVLSGLLAGAWHFHARMMRKAFHREADRIGKEKSKLQNVAAGRKLPGSRSKR